MPAGKKNIPLGQCQNTEVPVRYASGVKKRRAPFADALVPFALSVRMPVKQNLCPAGECEGEKPLFPALRTVAVSVGIDNLMPEKGDFSDLGRAVRKKVAVACHRKKSTPAVAHDRKIGESVSEEKDDLGIFVRVEHTLYFRRAAPMRIRKYKALHFFFPFA